MAPTDQSVESHPARIGRYRITAQLGSGPSGVVYHACDDDLRRDVAIKVRDQRLFRTPQDVDDFLSRARQVAAFEHPGIVPLYDAGTTADGSCYLVMKLVAGGSLADYERRERLSAGRAVRLAVSAAEALHQAHRHGLVHANIKPSNLFVDGEAQASVADFGQPLGGPIDKHTSAYLSPEQLRGEIHRIDARADVYSLGVVLYELLAGHLPHHSSTSADALDELLGPEPPSLGELVPSLPPELVRVCHKAIARRVSDRYTTALDLADDLRECLAFLSAVHEQTDTRVSTATPAGSVAARAATERAEAIVADSSENVPRVVPKGLRSFDHEDAEFFLELLPGPRGRDGLPESLRFWKARLEETDAEKTFSVGLIYGPSGCGKSSLVKAGLTPRLASHVEYLYLEATPDGTEPRLLKALRKRYPALGTDLPLTESLAEIRRGRAVPAHHKLVIILDQFEQWLHGNRDVESPELSRALRQCNGGRVQCVVLVRDDFWMAVTRFMHDLEIQLVEGQNSAAVDLFSPQHARKVLIAFGRAFGCLPEREADLSAAENDFLQQAIAGLGTDGKVISVQLALFAEMVKNKTWAPATLREVGGAEGIGLGFLEETFSALHAPPQYRRHQRAVRAVLRALLPESGTNIKGRMHSREELLAAAGYTDRAAEFGELLQILDKELRLVTPADPEGNEESGGRKDEGESESPASDPSSHDPRSLSLDRHPLSVRYYQLTHDFLVPSVRRWLVRKQQETRRGRAELLLEDKASTWQSRPERRYLPAWWQWLTILWLTRRRDWSAGQRSLMRAAARHHLLRGASLVGVLLLISWAGYEWAHQLYAQSLRDRVLFAETANVAGIIRDLTPYRRWVDPLLRTEIARTDAASREALHARLALLPRDATQVEPIADRALVIADGDFPVVAQALAPHAPSLTNRLWNIVSNEQATGGERLRAALLLARLAPPGQGHNNAPWQANANNIARQLHAAVVVDPTRFGSLVSAIAPASELLIDPLMAVFRDAQRGDSEKSIAANLVAEFASDRPKILVELLLEPGSTARQASILARLAQLRDQVLPLLEPLIDGGPVEPATKWNTPVQSFAAVDASVTQSIEAAGGMVSEQFAFCHALPWDAVLTTVEALRGGGYRPIQVRPYRTGDSVQVAVLWSRDGRKFSIQHDLDESTLRQQIAPARLQAAVLTDVAAYDDPKKGGRFVAVWSPRQPGDPETTAYLGPWNDLWKEFSSTQTQNGFGLRSQAFALGRRNAHTVAAVFWKGAATRASELTSRTRFEADLAGPFADELQVGVTLTRIPFTTSAETRRSQIEIELERLNDVLKTNPQALGSVYGRGYQHDRLRQFAQAIDAYTKYIDAGGEPAPSESWKIDSSRVHRVIAAARLGRRADAERFLTEYISNYTNDEYRKRWLAATVSVFLGDPHETVRQFDEFNRPHQGYGWALEHRAYILALAAEAVAATDGDRSQAYAKRAVDDLELRVRTGNASVWFFRNNTIFEALRDDPRMRNMHIELELDEVVALRYARRGQAEAARRELAGYLRSQSDANLRLRTEVLTSAFLGDDEQALRQLDAAVDAPQVDEKLLWQAACACSLMAWHMKVQNPDRAQGYSNRAIEFLRQRARKATGAVPVWLRRDMLTSWELYPLHGQPEFEQLVRELSVAWSFAASTSAEFESQCVFGLDPQEHFERARQLSSHGFRPVSVSACALTNVDRPQVASVWQRPVTTEQDREQQAARLAVAAAALVRLGKPDRVWPLLRQSSNPRVRTEVLHLLGPLGVDPSELARRVAQEQDSSIRRALVMALGEAQVDILDPTGREALVNQILDLFRRDRDPGVHSAAEWLLNKLGQHERVAAARLELSAAKTDVVPAWSESLLGTTLVRVAGPVEIQMGSPARELDRVADETRTRRRIPRTFAIATKEVTVEQFEKFKQAHPEIAHSVRRSHSPITSCPVGSLSWYQAMQFCRWLSAQEGLAEDEMCYPSIDKIGPKLEFKPYMFSRSGYRLPTEAEWEYAARSGADTPRFFGYAPDKLLKYAWTSETANERSWPVATLLPNELGLFDVYGNAEELCHQLPILATPNDRATRDDVLSASVFGGLMASRGGSSLHPAASARSAVRNPGKTTDNPAAPGPPHIGFRVVRTVPPVDLSAARALRRQSIALRAEGKLDEATGVLERAGAGYERLVGAHPDMQDYAWELADFLLDAAAGWVLLERVEATSQNGTTLTRQRDNSILASGKLPETDQYTVLGETHLPSIIGIKLEAMTDTSLPKEGPGRSPQGAFTVHIAPTSVWVVGENDRSLSFHRAFATGKWFFKPSQGGMGTSPNAGMTHVLAMEADSAAPLATGDRIRIVLNQSYPHSSLGRFRIWVTGNPRAGSVEYWRFNLERSSLSGPARLGCAYAALGRAEPALAALFQAGPTPAGDSPRDAFLLALANRAVGRNDDAQRWLARGLARWDQGNADRALMRLAADAMEIATDRAPDDLELLARRARLLYESEDLAFAQAFVPLIERHRNDPTPLIARGRLYCEYPKQSTQALADEDFKQAAELASDELHRFVDAGWWVIGPFPPELAAVQAPESNPDPAQPVKLGSQTLHWRQAAPDVWGKIDLKSIFAADGRSAYALTYVFSPDERTATLLVAADDAARVWLNGTLVHEVTAIRDVRENPERVPVLLKQGRNVLLAKVTNGFGHHFLGVRLADSSYDRGLSMAELGLWDEAARRWKRGLSRIPDDDLQPTDLYHLAAVLLAAKDRDGYRRICAQFFERFAQSPDPTPRMQLAYTAGLSSDSGITGLQLVDLLVGVPTDEPREAWRQVARAQALYRADRPGDALAILEQLDSAVEEWARAWSKAWLLRALCHHAQGRTTEATQWLDKAEALYAAAVGATLAAAEFKLPEQYWEFASVQILHREALAAIRPTRVADEHQVALEKRAREWLAGRDQLIVDFDDAVRLTPERPEVWLARARRNVAIDRPQQAAEDYFKALSLKSDNVVARNELHTLMARLGDQFNSDKPEAWHERGRMFLALGQVEQAIAAFGKALDLFPDTSAWDQPRSRAVDEYAKNAAVADELLRRRPDDTHLRLGIARRKVIDRQWRSAVADYAAIIYQRPPGHEAFEYAALLLLTGDAEGYQKFVRWMFDQIDDEPKPSVAYFWARTATLTAEPIVDSRRVVALAQRAVDSENNWHFPRTLAAALNQSGDLTAALVQLDSATQTGGQSKVELAFKAYYRGLFMLQAGRMKEARESLDQALATLPAASADSRPAARIELTLRRRQLELPLLAAEIAELTAALAQPTQDRAKLLGRRDAMQARREEIAAGFSAPLEYKPDEPQYWLARGRQFVELEQTEQALANYEQALDRFPESADWKSPHSRLVHECAKNADVMTSLLARRPNDSHLRLGRARRRLIDRQWRAALTDYAALIDGQTAGHLWLTSAAEYAGLLWLTGNRDGRRDVLNRMIERTGENPSPESAYVLAIAAGAAPDSGVEPNRMVAWARQAVDAQENARHAFGQALALYRAGDDAAVLRRLDATPGVGGWGNVEEVWNELVRAGVMLRAGRAKDGQQWLDRAVSHLPAVTTPGSEAARIAVALQAFKFRETGNAFGFNEAKRQLFFWRNGAAEATAKVPADGDYEIVVRASCDSAQNEHAKFKIYVDGEPVGKETLLTTTLAKEYTLTANIKAGEHTLVVEFTNDISKLNEITKKSEYDRNFYLHAVTLRQKVSQEFGPGDWLITQILRREIEPPVLAAGIAELTTELEQQPQNQNDLHRRADLYTRRRDWSSAADDIRRLVDGKPDDPDLLHRHGTALAHARRWREAGDDFVKLNQIKPAAAIHGICPATLYLEARDVGGYLRFCRELLEQARHTSDPMVAERTSKACLVTPLDDNLSRDALALAKAAVIINPRHELMSYFECNRGLAAYRTGDYSAAAVWCQRSLESDKKSPVWFRTADANLVLAMSLHRLGRNNEARQALSRGIELLEKQTESDEQENWLGDGWFDWIITSFLRREAEELLAGRDALAAYLDDAVRLLPEQPDVWHERGRLRFKLGQMEQAVADFDKALDLFPDDPSWTAPRSQAVYAYAEREDVFTALASRRPNDAQLRLGRGRRLIHAGKWREALAEYAAVIVKRSPSDEWLENSALLLLTGDREGYREFTTQSARLLGSSPAPDIAYFLARCASLAPEPAVEPQRAVAWARQAVNAAPTNSLHRHTLGLALYRAGDDSAALRELDESRTQGPEGDAMHVKTDLVLAMVHWRQGRTEFARERLERAIKNIPADPSKEWPFEYLVVRLLRREAEETLAK